MSGLPLKAATLALAGLAVLAIGGCGRRSSALSASAGPPPRALCGKRVRPRAWKHIVWILMENHGDDAVLRSRDAPYARALARACGVATEYSAITHPSLPNYVALTTGATQGIRDDGPPAKNATDAPSIFSQLREWRTYAESMPAPCAKADSGDYAVRHNPPPYLERLGAACAHNDLPLPRHPSLHARFTFVVPNVCHDMHDCPVSQGDRWLSRFLPELAQTGEYRHGDTVIFVTWDEDEGDDSADRVPLLVVGPS